MYQKMYAILCGAASEAIEALPNIQENQRAICILQAALCRAEDIYLDELENSTVDTDAYLKEKL